MWYVSLGPDGAKEMISNFVQTANAIARGKKPTIGMKTVDQFLFRSQAPQSYAQWQNIYDTALLCGQWADALKAFRVEASSSSAQAALWAAVSSAIDLENKFHDWELELPPVYSYSVISLTKEFHAEWIWPLLDGPWVPQYSHHYSSMLTEVKWRSNWTSRLILSQALLHTLEVLEQAGLSPPEEIPPVNRKEVELRLLELMDRICESVLAPIASCSKLTPGTDSKVTDVQSMRIYVLFSSLPCVHFCLRQTPIAGFEPSQRVAWVSILLQFIGKEMGFAKAGAWPDDTQILDVAGLPVQLWGLTE
jgi:hypothetical protein